MFGLYFICLSENDLCEWLPSLWCLDIANMAKSYFHPNVLYLANAAIEGRALIDVSFPHYKNSYAGLVSGELRGSHAPAVST